MGDTLHRWSETSLGVVDHEFSTPHFTRADATVGACAPKTEKKIISEYNRPAGAYPLRNSLSENI